MIQGPPPPNYPQLNAPTLEMVGWTCLEEKTLRGVHRNAWAKPQRQGPRHMTWLSPILPLAYAGECNHFIRFHYHRPSCRARFL
jgi:hypothetical protein